MVLNLIRTAAPARLPLDLHRAKQHLRIDGLGEDYLVQQAIQGVAEHLDGYQGILGRALITQTWTLKLDAFPAWDLRLPLPPLQAVTAIGYVDPDGADQVLDTAAYVVHPGPLAMVEPVYGGGWPTARRQRGAVSITFRVGYGDTPEALPAAIRSAALLMVADLFDNRDAASAAEAPAVRRLLRPYMIPRL